MEIAGKVAIVTGGGGAGTGRAVCLRLAREGAAVVVSDIREAGGLETVARIEAQGGRAIFLETDVSDEDAVRALIATTERELGGVDILFNDASGPEFRPDVPLEFWRPIVETELLGAAYGTRYAIDAMRRRGGGAIVNVSSTSALYHGKLAGGGSPMYDASKAAVLHLTTRLRFLSAENIRVNCLVPHWVASPGPKEYFDSLAPEEREKLGVPEKLIELEEMGDAVVRFVRDDSLAARAMVLWGGRAPSLLPFGDAGYTFLEPA